MNKKYFKEAIDEIHVEEQTKAKTLNRINSKKRIYAKYSLVLATIILVLVIGALTRQNPETLEKTKQSKTVAVQKVENYETLYKILEKAKQNENRVMINEMETKDFFNMATVSNEGNYSKTNIQIEGVEEADIVKTDGNYIYYISNNKIVIVDAKDAKNLKIVSEIKNTNEVFYPQEIFITKDKLISIGIKTYPNKKILYDYKSYTLAQIYDIKEKNNIKLEREVEIEGNYLSSRMIEDNIYLITNKNINLYRLLNEEEMNEIDIQVSYRDTCVGEEVYKINYDCMYYFPENEDSSYLNIATFNVNNNNPADIKTYLGTGNNVYCSGDNLYITNTIYEYTDISFYTNYKEETTINKFKLTKQGSEFEAQAVIPGRLLNQFSMDENKGYFRIATTNSSKDGNINNVYVLDKNLNIVGKTEDLAKGERIYSVRFMGDRAYVVTFVQTDPLFVIDLSTPAEPTVLGELKIPGFSNYLHPYDETHIIGFGQDTEIVSSEYGETVKTTGMKMALFDVSDPTSPKEMYVEIIGDSGTYSNLLNNHKALLFSKEKNIIGFPIKIKTEDNYSNKFQGAIIYGLNLEEGFTLKGKITHQNEKYDYEKEIERLIYIDNVIYTLSKSLIKAIDIETMEELSSVEIESNI